jgi:hypothetical protein
MWRPVPSLSSSLAVTSLQDPLNGWWLRSVTGLRQAESIVVCQPFGQPVPIGDMDGESFLKNPEIPLCLPRVLVSSLKRSDALTLAVDAALRPLHAQLGVFQMLFRCEAAGHPGP